MLLRFFSFLIALALLGLVVAETDLAQVDRQLNAVGWGIVPILAVFGMAFFVDTAAWQLVLRPARMTPRWFYDLWKIRMVGSAYNQIIPFVGVGGEPIKAVMLKKFCGVGYRDGAASLITTETCNLLSLVAFTTIGLVIAIEHGLLSAEYQTAAIAGVALFTVVVGTTFLLQVVRLSSFAHAWLSRWNLGRKLEGALAHIRAVDDRLVGFYLHRKGRFAAAFGLAFLQSLIGAVEVALTMYYLDHPISLLDAWAISALVEVVRIATFFIPASIGAQEGAFVFATSLVTGQPTLGLSLAVVRRVREIVWIVWGLLIGWWYSFTPASARALLGAADQLDGS